MNISNLIISSEHYLCSPLNISNPIRSSAHYVFGPCRHEPYQCGVSETVGTIVGVLIIALVVFQIKNRYEMYRKQQLQEKQRLSPFIRAFKDRVIHHTKDLPGENPIKSLAQKYIWRERFQQVKDLVC